MRFVILVLVGLALGLVAGETAARMVEGMTCHDRTTGFAAPSRLYGWGAAPGAEGWAQRCLHGVPEWRTYVRINQAGLRDREVSYARTDAYRILVLGDSFTEGLEVELEQTFSKRLEQLLNDQARGRRVEVINAGVAGWGTDNALLFYLWEGYKYQPDLVLLAFNTANDILENHHELVQAMGFYPPKPFYRLASQRLRLRDFPLPATPMRAQLLAQTSRVLELRSALYRLGSAAVREAHRRLEGSTPERGVSFREPTWEVYLKNYPPQWQEAWQITEGLLLHFRVATDKRNSQFAVVVIDGREAVSPQRWRWVVEKNPGLLAEECDVDKPHRVVTRFLARRGIPFVSLLDEFRGRFAENARPAYFEWDIHWAAPGHALAAETIARELPRLQPALGLP